MLDPGDARRRPRPAVHRLSRGARPARPLGPRPPAPPCRRAASVRASTPGTVSRSSPTASRTSPAPSGLCSRRSRGAPRCTCRCPTSPGGSRSHRCQRTADDLSSLADGQHRGAAAPVGGVRPSGTRAPGTGALPGVPAAAARPRRRCALPRGCRCARHARARRRGTDRADPRWHGAGADRARRTIRRAVAGAARDRARWARSPVRDRVARSPRRDAARPCTAATASLHLARRGPARALRIPALALFRPRALVGRLRRRPAARTSDPHAGAGRRGGREAPRGSRARTGRAARRRNAGGRRPRPDPVDAAFRLRHGRASGRRDLTARSAGVRRGATSPRRARGVRRRSARTFTRKTWSQPSSGPRCGLRPRTRPDESRWSICCAPVPVSYEAVFLLGLEEGSLPRRSRTSPFLDDDARRELGGRLERPDQVSRDRYLFYTACTRATRRLYLVREAATDDGARASRARSGRRSQRSSTTTTSRGRRCGGRSRPSRGNSRPPRPTASGCGRSRSSPWATPTALARLPMRTTGDGGSHARARRLRPRRPG